MNKYFLPVYHSQLKPWIKWWILKRLSGGQSSLKAVTLSSGTLTKVDKSMGLSIKEYYGNTVQNGTPTPEAPVEIQTISGDNTFTINGNSYRVDLGGKNLFNYQYSQLRNINRATISEETNGFKLTSTGVAGYGFASLPIDNNLLGKQVTISCNSSGNKTPSARLFYHNSSGSLTSNIGAFWTTNTAHTVTLPSTLPSGSTGIDIVFYISQGNNAEGDYVTFTNIQVELGTVATEYSPYVSNPIELCKIGNYKDTLFHAITGNPKYDSLDSTTKESLTYGSWYIEKNIGKRVFTGDTNTEIWSYATSGSYPRVTTNSITDGYRYNDTSRHIGKFLSSHFTPNTTDNTGHCYQYQASYLFNPTSDITSVATWRTWLGSNPMTLYYQLATPSYEIITNENLIQQLNALYEFYVNSSTVTISNNSEIPLEVLLEYYGR